MFDREKFKDVLLIAEHCGSERLDESARQLRVCTFLQVLFVNSHIYVHTLSPTLNASRIFDMCTKSSEI